MVPVFILYITLFYFPVASALSGIHPTEIPVGKAVDLRDALPNDDLGIAHRGSANIIKQEFLDQCIYQMGGSQTKQEEVISSSAQEFASSIAFQVGVDVNFGAFKFSVSRAVRYSNQIHSKRAFAKKTVLIQTKSLNIKSECFMNPDILSEYFVRDVRGLDRYVDCIAWHSSEQRRDLSKYPDFSHPEWQPYRHFLGKWGTGVLSAAIQGGAIEVVMSESSESQSNEENIKQSISAGYAGLGAVTLSVETTLKNSQIQRDGFLNILIAGGSIEARTQVLNRFESMLSKSIDSPQLNVTALWALSVESGHGILTGGKYVTWDKFPVDMLLQDSVPGFLLENLRLAISIHLKNSWSSGCFVYEWNTIKRECEPNQNSLLLNRKVHILADNGNCVEYDEKIGKLVARRKDCNMGYSIFTFNAEKGVFSLELNNKQRLVGSLKGDNSTLSLVPLSTRLSLNLAFTPDNFLIYSNEHHEKRFAYLSVLNIIEFRESKTPLSSQTESQFYLELFQKGYGNPLETEAIFRDFMIGYNNFYKGPYFRIVSPFWGEHLAIEPVRKSQHDIPDWPYPPPSRPPSHAQEPIALKPIDSENIAQLWKFQRLTFSSSSFIVYIVNARDSEHFCLDNQSVFRNSQPGINECSNHGGWLLEYSTEYGGSVRLRVPRTDLCLFRIEVNPNEDKWVLDDGFRTQNCVDRYPDRLQSMFKFQVVF